MSFNLMVQPHESTAILPWDCTLFLSTGTLSPETLYAQLQQNTTVLSDIAVQEISTNLLSVINWSHEAPVRAGLGSVNNRLSIFSGPGVVDITFNTSLAPESGGMIINFFEGDTDCGTPLRRLRAWKTLDAPIVSHSPEDLLRTEESINDRMDSLGMGRYSGALDGLDDTLVAVRQIHKALHG